MRNTIIVTVLAWFGLAPTHRAHAESNEKSAATQRGGSGRTAEIQLLRSVYKELVEINTTDSVGDNTRAAKAVAARLRAAGYPAKDVQVLVPPGAPKKGNLVARLRGKGEHALAARLATLVGSEQLLLIESPGRGRTACFAIAICEDSAIPGSLVRARVQSSDGRILTACVVGPEEQDSAHKGSRAAA